MALTVLFGPFIGPAPVLAAPLSALAVAPATALPAVPAGMRLLVRFRPEATEAERADALRSVGGWIDATIPALGVTRIALPGDANDAFGDGPAVAATLARHPAVASAELDRAVRIWFDPNDSYYKRDPYTDSGQWGIRKALVDKAWDSARGSASVTVALLDTGVDPDHPDLKGALVRGEVLVSQPSSECSPGATKDDNSHGTHVAGIVGATGNNATGIAGVAFGVKLMPLKVLDCTGVGSLSDVAEGLVWAVDHGAKVVNLSLGSPFDSTTLRDAIDYAVENDVLVVSAVGNCGTSGDRCTTLNQVEYPAAYPEVLAVGATDVDDDVAFFSSRNFTTDVTAPGRRIVSTTPSYATYQSRKRGDCSTLSYASCSGTSQASPFVTGLAALILSVEPELSASEVAQRIRSTADDLGEPGRDDGYGSGRVNALRAVGATGAADRYGARYDTSGIPRAVATGKAFTAKVTLTNTSSFTWRAAGADALRLQWSWPDVPTALPGATGTAGLASDVAAGASATLTATITPPPLEGATTLRLDLLRGTISFSGKGAAAATVKVTVGSGVGASYAPAAAGTASFDAGTTAAVSVTVTNTGVTTWPAAGTGAVTLSYHWLKGGAVAVWDGLRARLPTDVAPGAKVTLALPVRSPEEPGTYTLRLDLVQEGVAWFSSLGVAPFDLAANVRSAYVATYAPGAAPVLLPGGRAAVPITITNTGTATWAATGTNPVRLAAHVTDARGAVAIWDGARTTLEEDLAPGETLRTQLLVDAPLLPGAYRVRADLVREGVAWFSSIGVATGDTDLLVAFDTRAAIPGGPLTISRSDPTVRLALKNTGIATWTTVGAAPVNVAVHWSDAAGRVLVWDGPRTALPRAVGPGETVTVTVAAGPVPAGAAFLTIDLVSEGIAWFGEGPARPVTLAP